MALELSSESVNGQKVITITHPEQCSPAELRRANTCITPEWEQSFGLINIFSDVFWLLYSLLVFMIK